MMKRIFQDKKIIMTMLSILLVLSIMTSTTYSLLFRVNTLENREKFTAGVLQVEIDKGESVTLTNTLPLTDEDGANSTPYIFTIKNTGNLTYTFDLNLLSTTSDNPINYDYIKVKIDDGEIYTLSSIVDGLIYEDITLKPTQRKEIAVRVWLDYNTPNTEIGKNFSAKMVISGVGSEFHGDLSGANIPQLMSGMVPVEYKTISDGVETDGWYVADESTGWYNYGEQRWANAVLVTEESGLRTASAGTIVPEDDVLAYYVWIPRYKYKLFNAKKEVGYDSYNAQNTGIDVVFERGIETTGTVSCTISSIGVETCENAENGNYYTHPAFWWDSNDNGIRETSEELTGIWVGKFEISSETPDAEYGGGNSTTLSVRVKPNVNSWCYNNVSNFFTVIQNMMATGNFYGINNEETDSHMLKNIEWGAVAYLTNSQYGRCNGTSCAEVEENTSTKIGGGNYQTNVGQSTTGNITGVYDMNGGTNEYVMANVIYKDGINMISGFFSSKSDSGFKGISYVSGSVTNGIDYPATRYYDIYSYSKDYKDYTRGHLGDSTGEVVLSQGSAWNDGCADLGYEVHPWFIRGFPYNSNASVFGFGNYDGNPSAYLSTRSVLIYVS